MEKTKDDAEIGGLRLVELEDVGLLQDRKTYRTTLVLKKGKRTTRTHIDVDRAIQDRRGGGGMMAEIMMVVDSLGIRDQFEANWMPVFHFSHWLRKDQRSPFQVAENIGWSDGSNPPHR